MPAWMKTTALLLMLLCGCAAAAVSGQLTTEPAVRYAQSVLPTPVLNTPEFASVFGTRGVATVLQQAAEPLRALEFIGLPDTVFTVKAVIRQGAHTIYRVTTGDYPYPSPDGYYIDSRFVRTYEEKPPDRAKRLPDMHTITASLISADGSRYLWGGNLREGIPHMLDFYPPPAPLTPDERSRWILQGLDCSGLLYQATGGFTPRNTSSLTVFGEAVPIVHLSVPQMMEAVVPLDIIVWPGHVIIVLDQDRVIESRLDYDETQAGNQGGVRIRKLGEVLSEVLKERTAVNSYDTTGATGQKQFVIRRWYPHGSHH